MKMESGDWAHVAITDQLNEALSQADRVPGSGRQQILIEVPVAAQVMLIFTPTSQALLGEVSAE